MGLRGGHVYFVETEGTSPVLVKIGYSTNVAERLGHIRTACPFPLKFWFAVEGEFELEKMFHERFEADHWHGEWFVKSEVMTQFIAEKLFIPEFSEVIVRGLAA